MSRHSFAPLVVTFARHHPSRYALAALALVMTGWAATGGFADAAGADEARTVPRSGPTAGTVSGTARPAAILALPSASATVAHSPSVSVAALRTAGTGVAPDQALSRRLAPVVAATPASLSVAVLDPADGRAARYGVRAGTTYDTASIVKVDILAALLLKAQDEHRGLTAQEKASAASMIRISDNASADALWRVIGEAPGLNAANGRLGLTGTTGGGDGHWGLTQTTATDQLALLSAVFGTDSPLDQASRACLRGLMGGIAAGQDWGVSAAGPVTGLKNGWLQRTATGRWDVNSIGLVRVDGHDRLVAVLSRGSVSMADGVQLVEKAAKAAVQALDQTA
ncbi:serine hydrolase [Streptomyces sp. NBC_00873]|uniref:serine hydrolase n=1 Tax=unclassified Streptomyces TaxID=2593676 RepID=UPI00386D540E|nr:serine hydrolase [Streptomyces sp. NBC_00873]WSY96655.1 serine hydrolase [Streptomyces sp. NBC_00873]WTA41571.1 serine hydrolase [Streptomyces sp. NBC_00842]WTA48325.1 serine hydrolase [Streptomyces sp. NBC_00842]